MRLKPSLLLCLLASSLLLVGGCDTFGGGDDDAEVTITARTEAPNGSLVENSQVTFVSDGDSTTKTATNGTAKTTYEKSDASVTVIGDAAGRQPAEETTPDRQSDHTVTLVLEENPDEVSANLSATVTDADTTAAADFYLVRNAEKDSLLAENHDGGAVSLPYQEGPVTIRAEAQHLAAGTGQLRLDADNPSVEIALQRETVPVILSAVDAPADTTVAATYYANGEQAAEGQKADVVLEYQPSPTEFRAEAEYFHGGRKELQPAAHQHIEFGLERKTVELTILPEKQMDGSVMDSARTVIREPNGVDSTVVFGEATVELFQQAGEREIVTTAIVPDPEKDDHLDRYEPVVHTIAADESVSLTSALKKLAACRDEITNDGDDLVDEEDPGCWNQQGEYLPEDDNEGHIFVQHIGISGGEGTEGTTVVSSAEGERQYGYPGGLESDRVIRLHPSIVDAVDVGVTVETEKDSTQADETFAAKLKCGPSQGNLNNINVSGIVPDNQEQHGWEFTPIPDVETYFFDTGNKCRVVWQHGTLVRGEPTGDGNDDVFFLKPDDTQRALVFSHFVQEEDFEDGKSRTLTQGSEECRSTRYGQTCHKVASDGFGDRLIRR